VELLAWTGPSPALALLHLASCTAFQGLGRYEEMQVAAERAAEIAEAIGDERLLAWAMERRGTALNFLGRIDEARLVLEDALRLLERVGDPGRPVTALRNIGEASRVVGALQETRPFIER